MKETKKRNNNSQVFALMQNKLIDEMLLALISQSGNYRSYLNTLADITSSYDARLGVWDATQNAVRLIQDKSDRLFRSGCFQVSREVYNQTIVLYTIVPFLKISLDKLTLTMGSDKAHWLEIWGKQVLRAATQSVSQQEDDFRELGDIDGMLEELRQEEPLNLEDEIDLADLFDNSYEERAPASISDSGEGDWIDEEMPQEYVYDYVMQEGVQTIENLAQELLTSSDEGQTLAVLKDENDRKMESVSALLEGLAHDVDVPGAAPILSRQGSVVSDTPSPKIAGYGMFEGISFPLQGLGERPKT